MRLDRRETDTLLIYRHGFRLGPIDNVFQVDGEGGLGDFLFEDDQDEVPAEESEPLQVDVSRVSPEDMLCATGGADRGDLSKIEEAVLDLAEVGMTVAKAAEIIPESDEEIYTAVRSLLAEGLLTLA